MALRQPILEDLHEHVLRKVEKQIGIHPINLKQ